MKRISTSVLVLGLFALSFVGCGEKATTTKEIKVTTPGGTTTTTETQEIKKTGENPPPAQR